MTASLLSPLQIEVNLFPRVEKRGREHSAQTAWACGHEMSLIHWLHTVRVELVHVFIVIIVRPCQWMRPNVLCTDESRDETFGCNEQWHLWINPSTTTSQSAVDNKRLHFFGEGNLRTWRKPTQHRARNHLFTTALSSVWFVKVLWHLPHNDGDKRPVLVLHGCSDLQLAQNSHCAKST